MVKNDHNLVCVSHSGVIIYLLLKLPHMHVKVVPLSLS